MLPSSLTVSLSITVLGLLSVAAFLWAWFSGQFDDIERPPPVGDRGAACRP